MIPPTKEFQALLDANIWTPREEAQDYLDRVMLLSGQTTGWHWSRNWDCKYVTLRFDMRDGGFIMMAGGQRISLAQLTHQRGAEHAVQIGSTEEEVSSAT